MKPTISKKTRKLARKAFDMAYSNHAVTLAETVRSLVHTERNILDEGGYFAYWQPNGKFEQRYFDERVNGCDSEAEAVEALIRKTLLSPPPSREARGE